MSSVELTFWVCVGCVAYAYAVYPALLGLAGLVVRRRPRCGPAPESVSVVLAAHNEAGTLTRRLGELSRLLNSLPVRGELIVVSDGSTDGTAALARGFGPAVRVVEFPGRLGKAAALTAGAALSKSDVLVFADARQTWAPDALGRLLGHFTDPGVGGATGDLVLQSPDGTLAGVGVYWRYEKWIRRQESKLHSTVGVTGAISAVRRELFAGVPSGTLLDDVYWPLRVALRGYRVVHDPRAEAYDRLPEKVRDEFRRKVRTLSGNFQLVTRLPAALRPWRNPVLVQFVSHKLARLLAPWALLGALAASAALPGWYQVAFWAQVGGYAGAAAALRVGPLRRNRLFGLLSSFVVLNAAAWLAFWVWAGGRAGRSWAKVSYAPAAAEPVGSSAPDRRPARKPVGV